MEKRERVSVCVCKREWVPQTMCVCVGGVSLSLPRFTPIPTEPVSQSDAGTDADADANFDKGPRISTSDATAFRRFGFTHFRN